MRERLIAFLTALGQDVEITVRPTRKPREKCPWSREGVSISGTHLENREI
jgi:hypothetical protein